MRNPGEREPVLPDFTLVRETVGELFNTACKAKMNAKYSTWKQAVSLGSWEVIDPTFVWPTVRQSGAQGEEEGEMTGFRRGKVFNVVASSWNFIISKLQLTMLDLILASKEG